MHNQKMNQNDDDLTIEIKEINDEYKSRPILVESNSLKLEFKLILCNPRFLLDS